VETARLIAVKRRAERSILAHYTELALKGRNRSWFVRRLVRNLHQALAGLGVREILTLSGRLEIVLGRDGVEDEVCDRLTRVFGIANFSRARRVPSDVEGIAAAILDDLPALDVESFRVSVRRADKTFPVPSPELARDLGSRVWTARGWRVNLTDPAFTIGVEIAPGRVFVHLGREAGAGGLPTGTSGRVVALLSGGIDSPVAAWRMMRRGCQATFVHFHGAPFLATTSAEKARRLAEVLTRYQLTSRLFLVPFGELQRQVTLAVPGDLRVVVYRRFMLRIAERVARQIRAKGLVTGDVVGQVASQTLDNMAAIESAATLPVFRPLIGMDKEEIIVAARRLGTFEISIVPDEDCCTLFTPRHPETHARTSAVDEAERALPIDEMVAAALRGASVERLAYPVITSAIVR